MLFWFRHYLGLARDEKLVGAALRSEQPIERVVWLWSVILEDAASRNDGGAFAIDPDECAYFLRCGPGEISLIMAELEAGGRIGGGRVLAWERRQRHSDRSAERTAKWRERRGPRNVTETRARRHRDAVEKEKEKEKERLDSELVTSPAPELAPEHVVKHWNKLAGRIGKPEVRDLTPERRQRLKQRIGQYSVADFALVLQKVEASSFLRGDGGWQGCTFDWITKKANFQKIIEGNYDH